MKKFIAMIVIMLLSCTLVFAGITDGDPKFTKTYETSKGNITFNHQSHAVNLKDCAFCHSQLELFGGSVNKDFGHKACKICHKRMNQTKGKSTPTICTGCHIKTK